MATASEQRRRRNAIALLNMAMLMAATEGAAGSDSGGSSPTDLLTGLVVTPRTTNNGDEATIVVNLDASVSGGNVYFVVCLASATAPNEAQIVAGDDGSNANATWALTVPEASIEVFADPVTGLEPEEDYVCYAVWYDGVSEYSNIASDAFTSLGTAIAGAQAILDAYQTAANGLAIDWTDNSMVVESVSDPTDDYSGTPAAATSHLTITGTLSSGASGCTIDASNFFSIVASKFPRVDDSLTILMIFTATFDDDSLNPQITLVNCPTSGTEYFRVYIRTDAARTGALSIQARDTTGGVATTLEPSTNNIASTVEYKLAMAMSDTHFRYSINGAAVQSGTHNMTVRPTLSVDWQLGRVAGTGDTLQMKKLVILPEVISDANLQAWGA